MMIFYRFPMIWFQVFHSNSNARETFPTSLHHRTTARTEVYLYIFQTKWRMFMIIAFLGLLATLSNGEFKAGLRKPTAHRRYSMSDSSGKEFFHLLRGHAGGHLLHDEKCAASSSVSTQSDGKIVRRQHRLSASK